ncbi:hypothetical protein HHI36_003104 [Cryptolaemus montrouzieri]|uniref:Uncharacterized protein n=1 Tax=Cryptolaemus montrouzieri TaxID=559131 RepID=A0ABD2PCY3_9CUCU
MKKGTASEILKDLYINIWLKVAKSQRSRAGVSILMRKDLQNLLSDYKCFSERIIQVNMNLYGLSSVIIGIFPPTDDADQQTKDEFHQKLTAKLESFKQKDLPQQTQTLNEKNKTETNRYNVRHSQNDDIRDMYQKRLILELENLNEDQDVEEEYENVKKAIDTAADEGIEGEPSKKIRKEHIWLNDKMKFLIQEESDAYIRWLTNRTLQNREIYN